MNIKGLDYNTQRDKLQLPEYGREIKKMVDYCLTLEDRYERQVCAETIVSTMDRMFRQECNREDRMQKLWDHLAIMSDFKLDIDYPVDITQAHNIAQRPQPLAYSQKNPRVRHYGAILFEVFDKLKSMPAGEERDALTEQAANQMKRCLVEWGHGSNDDEKVADDLARYTDGVIQLDLSTFRFAQVHVASAPNNKDKKKKKK